MYRHKVQDSYIGMLLNKKAYMRLRHNHHPRAHRQTLSMLIAYLNNIHKRIEDFIQIHVIVAMDLCTCTYYIFTRKLHITYGYSLVWGLIKQAVVHMKNVQYPYHQSNKHCFFHYETRHWITTDYNLAFLYESKKKEVSSKRVYWKYFYKIQKKKKIQLLKDLN